MQTFIEVLKDLGWGVTGGIAVLLICNTSVKPVKTWRFG
jgi:hypothetical protein